MDKITSDHPQQEDKHINHSLLKDCVLFVIVLHILIAVGLNANSASFCSWMPVLSILIF